MNCEHVKVAQARNGETITATAGVWICPWCRANQLESQLIASRDALKGLTADAKRYRKLRALVPMPGFMDFVEEFCRRENLIDRRKQVSVEEIFDGMVDHLPESQP